MSGSESRSELEQKSESKPESASELSSLICQKINNVFTASPAAGLELLVAEIGAVAGKKGGIFLHGVGREGLMMKALCMRLFHLGLSAHYVGDMTTPPISSSDLLLSSAGPGRFPTVDAICSVAKSAGARVVLITAQPSTASSSRYADAIAYLPAKTMADDDDEELKLLPMGSLYEGAMYVLFEMVVYKLSGLLGLTPRLISSRHTNLE